MLDFENESRGKKNTELKVNWLCTRFHQRTIDRRNSAFEPKVRIRGSLPSNSKKLFSRANPFYETKHYTLIREKNADSSHVEQLHKQISPQFQWRLSENSFFFTLSSEPFGFCPLFTKRLEACSLQITKTVTRFNELNKQSFIFWESKAFCSSLETKELMY